MTSDTLTATMIGGHFHGQTLQVRSYPDHVRMAVPTKNYAKNDGTERIIDDDFLLYKKVNWAFKNVEKPRVFYVLHSLSNDDVKNQITKFMQSTSQH